MQLFTSRLFVSPQTRIKLHFRRFEMKYLISPEQYQAIKQIIERRIPIDPFAQKKGYYWIDSIYHDSPTLTSYQHNKSGVRDRVKYRLRTYRNDDNNPVANQVFWEIKRKRDTTVIKDRGMLSYNESVKLLRGTALTHPDPIITKFLFARRRHLLAPKILVRYRREPFIGETPEIRVTFDHSVLVSSYQDATIAEGVNVFAPWIIFELKFTSSLPQWLGEVIAVHNLERLPVSKYVAAIEKINHHLLWITP